MRMQIFADQSEWIESAGGPLLLVSKISVDAWKGTHASSTSEGLTDYDRACAVTEEIGTIRIANAMGVVLGDEPDRTCIILDQQDIFLVRWRWAESEAALLSAVRSSMHKLPFEGSEVFSSTPGEHVLFDSACAASEIDSCVRFVLEHDKYLLETALLKPEKSTCALLHRLRSW